MPALEPDGDVPFPPPSRSILRVRVDDVTMTEAVVLCDRFIAERRRIVATPNPEMVVAARDDATFRHALARADLAIPDGGGLLLAGRLWGRPFREQVRGTDLVYRLVALAAGRGYRLFLLGAAPGVAEEAGRRLRDQFPGLVIAGAYAGLAEAAHDDETRGVLSAAGPIDILLVAYGAGRQEPWMARNVPLLDVGVAVGVGGVLNFVSGRVPRAPRWMREARLEWLHRFIVQPWRWRRLLKGALYFPWIILRTRTERRRARLRLPR